jgi:DNA topoisomerase VI subunit B
MISPTTTIDKVDSARPTNPSVKSAISIAIRAARREIKQYLRRKREKVQEKKQVIESL